MSNAISKSYNSIKELPSEVRSSFDERDQQKWMDAYNKASENKEPEEAKVDAWMSMVDAPSSLAVETWGSVEVRDADGELVPVKTIEEYADKFIENGGLMHDSHSNVPVGTVWDYEVRKHPETGQDGIVFYFNIYRDGEVFERARDDILSGRKQAVSIGAEAPRGGYKCDDRGCYVERDVTDLYELSICETPANPEAYFINVGKDIAKAKTPIEGEVFRIGIKDVIVHQDYTTCPLQKCKHDLLNKGFKNIHITDNGIVIAKSKKNEYKLFKAIHKMGYPFKYNLKKEQFEIMPDYGVEQAIEEAIENGWAHEDQIGHICLTKEIPKEVFMDWYDRGFICKIGDFYCLKADDVAKEDMKKSEEYKTVAIEYDDWNNARCPKCGKIVDEELDTCGVITSSDDPINGDRFRVTCQNCGNVFDVWHEDPKNTSTKKKVKKSKIKKSMYTVDTPYGYSIKFIEGQDRLFSEGELVHAYSSFERLCESPSQKEYFNAYAEDYGCMYNADDVYNVLYDVQMSIANPQFRKSAKKKVKKSDDVGKGLKKYEQYIPDMTERYPEGRRPVGGDDEPNPPSEKRLWEGDADMDFIREVLNYGEFIDTYETPVSMAYHFRYNGKGYYIINEYAHVDSYGEIIPAMVLEKSVKKKVKKDGGAMGVGDAGATNAVYGAKPTSLTNPDKKYGKKKKTKKEFTDDGNIHGPKPTKTPKAKSR